MVKWSKNKPKAIPEAVPDKSTKEASLLLTDPVSNGSDAARRVMPLPPALLASLDGDEVTITRLTSVKADERPKGDRVELGGKPIYSFEFWHYHLLNVMFGFNGDSISGLTENISSTFGHDLAEEDVRALILQLNDLGLLNPTEARRHFLIKQILAENILSPDTATWRQRGNSRLLWRIPEKLKGIRDSNCSVLNIPSGFCGLFRDLVSRC
jgi:hypothetical protein